MEELAATQRQFDALSFSQGCRKRHRQSHADNEWALPWQRGSAFSLDSRVESTVLMLLFTGDRFGA